MLKYLVPTRSRKLNVHSPKLLKFDNLIFIFILIQVYPLLYVDDSAILDIKFKSFSYTPPSGFDEILVEQTLLWWIISVNFG